MSVGKNDSNVTPKLVNMISDMQMNNDHIDKIYSCDHSTFDTMEIRWKCTQCTKSNIEFDSQSKLKLHTCLHHNSTKPFRCQQCDLTFDRCSQLDYHCRSVHLGEKSQICQICGKGFFRKTDLRTHLNIHLGTNLCVCEICGRKFNHVSNLIRHCRMHAGLKPYPCSICGKRFTQISSLARHKRIHERENNANQQQLSNPMNPMENITSLNTDASSEGSTPANRKIVKRQHYCKICGESFHSVLLLRHHEKSHLENTEPIECKNCWKTFQKINDIKEHQCTVTITKKSENEKKSVKQAQSKKMINGVARGVKKTHKPRSARKKTANKNQIEKSIIRENSESTEKESMDQLEKSNSEQLDVSNNNALQEYLFEIDGKCATVLLDNGAELNISTAPNSLDCDQTELYECVELNKYVEEKYFIDICKQLNVNITQEKKKNKSSNASENSTETESETKTSEWKENDLDAMNSTNLHGTLEKTQFPMHIDFATEIQEGQEKNSKCCIDTADNSTDTNASSNTFLSNGEPTLRLVQTETGEQFYELLINNFMEKGSTLHASKNHDKFILEESTTVPENDKNSNDSDIRDYVTEVTNQSDPDLHTFSMNNDFDNAQYVLSDVDKNFEDLHSDEKEQYFYITPKNKEYLNHTSEKEIQYIHSLNLNLLESDSQANFEQYVATNFEGFEKSNYENSTEQFLQFIEIAEGDQEDMITPAQSDPPSMRSQFSPEDSLEFSKDFQTEIDDPNKQKSHDNVQTEPLSAIIHNDEEVQIQENSSSNSVNTIKQKGYKDENKKPCNEPAGIQSDNNSKSSETKKSKAVVKKYQCTECEKVFSNGYNYKQHMGTHFTDQQKFSCKECGIFFAWKSTLNKHMANNHRPDGRRKFVCDMCPKVYGTLSQVNEHVKRDHLKQRNHVCPYCGKSFFKKFDLKTHSRVHTDERPYVCRACGKRFHHQSHIIRHERIHSGERPYSCEICQKTFTQPGSLKIHKQKHQELRVDILEYPIDEDDPLITL